MKKFKLNAAIISVMVIAGLISFTSCKKERPTADGGGDNITLYRTSGDNIVKVQDYDVRRKLKSFQQDVQKHQDIWSLVKKVVPSNRRDQMPEFMIFGGEKSGTAGYVHPVNDGDLSSWRMGIAIDLAYDGGFNANNELSYTIIHEYGHILTLNDSQINANVADGSCPNFHTSEGCTNASSYLNIFYDRFWKDIASEHQAAEQKGDRGIEEFYDKYSSRFVTAYAASNPGEDIAESFAVFVTRADKPTGSTIADQKVALLYDFPELVELRNSIRSNLGSTGRSKSSLPAPGSWKRANNPTHHSCLHH